MTSEIKMKEKLESLKQDRDKLINNINILQNNILSFQKQLEQTLGAISITEEFLNPVTDIAEKRKEIKKKK